MNYQRKQIPFVHNGMNWNTPIEKLADGQYSWCKNVRVLAKGTISSSHGNTLVFSITGASYIHSISRLNILNQATNVGGATAFDPNLRRTYVVGADENLYVFQDQVSLANPLLNPVFTAPGSTINQFSGNPLSVIDVQPAGAAVAWKYIADSTQMRAVGYYPGDVQGSQMARCLPVGLPVPVVSTTLPAVLAGGNLVGGYQWIFAYRNVQTGARSNPSCATRDTIASPPTTGPVTGFSVNVTVPDVPYDPQSPGATPVRDSHIVVDIYRFGGNVLRWALVGSAPGGSVFHDNTSDESLLAAPSPPQATDSATGLTRFNLYQPFVTQDIARRGTTATLAQNPNGVWFLTVTDHSFNPNWIAGSTITVGGVACTIYQVRNDGAIELAEDVTGQLAAGTVTWSTNAGTLMSGQPLAHIWGPYGVGQSGSYVFACGDPNARGTLYWTNGNDPDSTDIVNNIIVTSPSERLMTGCVYDGQPFCWSTERQFQIFPSLTIFGQFTAQEVAGAKGVWLEWSLSVQSNGLTDQSVSWRGKDGIYDWSSGGGLRRLTDDLYLFFPHDNSPSIAPETILPFIDFNAPNPEFVGNLDDTQPKYHRLCWFHGLLFYDFVALSQIAGAGSATSTFSTLVWDTVNTGEGGGWVSLDQPFGDQLHPVARGIEIGANLARKPDDTADVDSQNEGSPPVFGPAQRGGNLKVSWGANIYDYYGLTRGFESRVITRAEDLGDSRAPKRWGDYWLDCTPLSTFTVTPLAGFHTCALQSVTVPDDGAIPPDFCPRPPEPGSRAQFVLDFVEFEDAQGAALLTPTLGLDITWTANDGQFTATIDQWQPSYVVKPEIISFRSTDPDDSGQLQAKYYTGLNLEANTFGTNCFLNVLLDGAPAGQIEINHNGQSEHPYAISPKVAYEAQLQMDEPQDVNAQPVTWQLFKINWIYEVWPDAVDRAGFFTDLGYVGAKFMQGMVVPMETGGTPASFYVNSDCGQSATMGPVQTAAGCKNEFAFSFGPCNTVPSDPFIAHEVQIVPVGAPRIWHDKIKWIWEPEPELVSTWATQPTDHDLPGWHSLRDCYIAYRGGGGAPTLYITTEYGTESYLLDAVTSNQYTRCYRVLKPQKAKWRSYRVEGCGLFRLYLKDCEVRAKAWGSNGPYVSFQPFGDLSRANGGARI